MKKILLLSMLVLGMSTASLAQSPDVVTLSHSGDTVTNAETEYLTTSAIKGSYDMATFQYVCVKQSGTVAGTATLQASLDNSYWVDIDTVTNTNVASQTFVFDTDVTSPARYKYYRVKCTGTGTMAARVYCYVLFRQ